MFKYQMDGIIKWFLLLVVLISVVNVQAYTEYGDIHTGDSNPGTPALYNRSMVMDSGGWLYVVYRDTHTDSSTTMIYVARSTDSGVSWDSHWQQITDSSSYGHDDRIAGCALAIDEFDNLYVVWDRYTYTPTYHATYIRKCTDTRTSPVWTSIAQVYSSSIKSNEVGVAIDSCGYIWVLTGGPSNWKATVWKSDSLYARGLTFTSVGCPSTGSCQNATMCIDKNNNVHLAYYDNSSSNYAIHCYYDGTDWSPRDGMGNGSTGGRDHNCGMAADDFGNVHILYGNNIGDTHDDWYFKYRLWTPDSGIGAAVDLLTISDTVYPGVANRYISNICCSEITGIAFVLIRDLNEGGSLCLYKKSLTDSAFTLEEEITADNMTNLYYYMPRMRGSIYPDFNNTSIMIDMAWTEDPSGSSHEPFDRYILSEGPALVGTFPPSGSWVSADTCIVLSFLDLDGIDPTTAEILVDGILYTVSSPELTTIGDSLVFRSSSSWGDDDVEVELVRITDVLGHASPDSGISYSFTVDKSPPVLTYREPDSGFITDTSPAGALIHYIDNGCGTDSCCWEMDINGTAFEAPGGGGLIIESDSSFLIDFYTGGVSIPSEDTSWIHFTVWDKPDVGEPNSLTYSWWFLVSTGIDEVCLPTDLSVDIHPNPFNSAVSITAPEGSEVEVFDVNGRKIKTLGPSATPLEKGGMEVPLLKGDLGDSFIWQPAPTFGSGVYLARATIGKKSISKRIVYLK